MATPRMMISIFRSRPPRPSQLSSDVSASSKGGFPAAAASRPVPSNPAGLLSLEGAAREYTISIYACIEMMVPLTRSRTISASSPPKLPPIGTWHV